MIEAALILHDESLQYDEHAGLKCDCFFFFIRLLASLGMVAYKILHLFVCLNIFLLFAEVLLR